MTGTPHAYATLNMGWVGPQGQDVRDLERLDDLGVTIIGLQECRIAYARGFLERNPRRWGILTFDSDAFPEHRAVAVLYRKDLYWGRYEYAWVTIGELGTAGAGEDRIRAKVINASVLRVKSGPDRGIRFRVLNTHLVASAWRPWPAISREGRRRKAAWNRQARTFMRWALKPSRGQRIPAVGGGDFNRNWVGIIGIRARGWRWARYSGITHRVGAIDHVGSLGGIKRGKARRVPMEGSDHDAVLVPFTLPRPPKRK